MSLRVGAIDTQDAAFTRPGRTLVVKSAAIGFRTPVVAHARVASLRSRLKSCRAYKIGGQKFDVRLVPIPKIGDESVAVRVDLTFNGLPVRGYQVVVRSGSQLASVTLLDVRTPDLAFTETLARKALARL